MTHSAVLFVPPRWAYGLTVGAVVALLSLIPLVAFVLTHDAEHAAVRPAAPVVNPITAHEGGHGGIQPVAVVRLLFTLVPLMMLVVTAAGASRMSKRMAVAFSVAMVGLTLWGTFEAATSLYEAPELDEWVEVALMMITVSGIAAQMIMGVREDLQRQREAAMLGEYDALTGLRNRAGIERFYGDLPSGVQMDVVMIDLNNLKGINDAGGHGAGDAHLVRVARAIQGVLPGGGVAGRWGGDEFVLLLPGTEGDAASVVAKLEAQVPMLDCPAAFASGIASVTTGEPLARSLALADSAMYQAKEQQREGVTNFGARTVGFEAYAEHIETLQTPEAIIETGFTLARELLGFDTALYFTRQADRFVLSRYDAHPHHTRVSQVANSAPPARAAQARTTATGVVFFDQNHNLERDPGEPGLPQVSVSNGLEVVQTDAEGRYRVSVSDETVIFVTKPAGYMVPVSEAQLPQFYYLHYPDGTPMTLEFGGIEPTGPLPESVDFPLFEQAAQNRFDAVAFADPQTADDTDLSYLRDDVIAELIGTDALFGLTAGDVVDDDLSLYARHNDLVAAIGLPWWNVPGNHDVDFDAPSDRHATDTYKGVFGPTYYSYDYGRVHFVGLDNVDYEGAEEGGYRGYVSRQQITWLRNDLRFVPDDKLIVIVTHIPLFTGAVDRDDALVTVSLPELLAVLGGREHAYTLLGHDTSNSWQNYLGHEHGWNNPEPLHHQVLAEVRGDGWGGPEDEYGVPETTMQDGNPNGYYLLSFDGNTYRTRFKAAGEPGDYQMRIMLEQEASGRNQLTVDQWQVAAWQAPQLVVNVFDGGERHEVEYRLNDSDFSDMTHTLRTDPYMEDRYLRLLGTDEEVGNPAVSSHIWVADLPEDLGPGVHTVTVRSTDPYGQVSEASQVFEVED